MKMMINKLKKKTWITELIQVEIVGVDLRLPMCPDAL